MKSGLMRKLDEKNSLYEITEKGRGTWQIRLRKLRVRNPR